MPTVDVTERQWKFFQRLTGQTRPGSKIREVLDEYMQHHAVAEARRLAQLIDLPPTGPQAQFADDSPLAIRWKALGCAKRMFDDFNKARDWYVAQFISEQAALTELEERHANEGLNNPRGWIYRKWTERAK